MNHEQIMGLTADIAVAHVSKNTVAVGDVPTLIRTIYSTLSNLGADNPSPDLHAVADKAAIRKSTANPDFIVSFEDGKRYKMLKRHLAQNGLTPDEYRAKWGLPKDYPMTAPSYTAKRRQLALNIGLGRKPKGVK